MPVIADAEPAIAKTCSVRRTRDADTAIGQRVRARRMLIDMSQEKLGARLGLTFQQIQKYEKGLNRIGAGRLWEIARILGVRVEYFYEGLQQDDVPIDGTPLFSSAALSTARLIDAIPDPVFRTRCVRLIEKMLVLLAEA